VESPDEQGAAHLLSTAAYGGNGSNSALRTAHFLASLGATATSSADRTKISYDLSVLPDRAEPAVAAILSLLFSAPPPPHAVTPSPLPSQ
jgi:predicted Zn-dependent peptidase